MDQEARIWIVIHHPYDAIPDARLFSSRARAYEDAIMTLRAKGCQVPAINSNETSLFGEYSGGQIFVIERQLNPEYVDCE